MGGKRDFNIPFFIGICIAVLPLFLLVLSYFIEFFGNSGISVSFVTGVGSALGLLFIILTNDVFLVDLSFLKFLPFDFDLWSVCSIIFSVITTLVFFYILGKIYKNYKGTKRRVLVLVIGFVVFFILQVIGFLISFGLSIGYGPLADVATERAVISEDMSGCQDLEFLNQISCVKRIVQNTDDPGICYELEEENGLFLNCVHDFASKLNDINVCYYIKTSDYEFESIQKNEINKCIAYAALNNNNSKACFRMVNSSYAKDLCLKDIVGKTREHELCYDIEKEYVKDRCFKTAGSGSHSVLVCKEIKDTEMRDQCLRFVGNKVTDGTVCPHITDSNLKDSCFWTAARINKNALFCQQIQEFNKREDCIKRYSD